MESTRNGGDWTDARFHSFITSGIRQTHSRWGQKARCKKEAWIRRGVYRCAVCGIEGPATLPPKEGNKRRINNACIDHIKPVVDPKVGFTTWDEFIDRMFVEIDGYQLLCHSCHKRKTDEERKLATERRKH